MAAVELLFTIQQANPAAAAGQAAAPAPLSPPAPGANVPAPDQLRRDIQQAISDARQAARDAAHDAGRGGKTVRIEPGGVIVSTPSTPPIPGMMVHDPFDNSNLIPPQAVDIAMGFFLMCAVMVVGWPISRALGRRLERRGEIATIPPALTEQLQRIEQAVDAMSIEVERISESQRFMAKLQNQAGSERMALPHER